MDTINLEPGTEYVSVGDIPRLIAEALCPSVDGGSLSQAIGAYGVEEDHKRALRDAIVSGDVATINPLTRLPMNGQFQGAVVTCAEFKSYVEKFGLQLKFENRADLSSDRSDESPSERKARLCNRKEELKANGIRNCNEVLAKEEGTSVSNIKKLTAKQAVKTGAPKSSSTILENWARTAPSNASK